VHKGSAGTPVGWKQEIAPDNTMQGDPWSLLEGHERDVVRRMSLWPGSKVLPASMREVWSLQV
jgi:hypothetical protein